MASILHESTIDPFDSQEAKPYKQDPEIVAMTNLVAAFRNNQIKVRLVPHGQACAAAVVNKK